MDNKKLIDKSDYEICKEAGLNTTLLTNNINNEVSKKKIKATANIIARILAGSAGPYGSTAIIQAKGIKHLVTKDGLDIVNQIQFEDDTATVILDMIRMIANSQVITVGDGSTSAILIANFLYQYLADDNLNIGKTTPKDILNILNTFAEWMEKKIAKAAKPISPDYSEIKQIATIATNNDPTIGELVRETYAHIGKYGFVTTDKSASYQYDEVEYKQGVEWDRGYVDDAFTREYKSKKIVHKKPVVFICKGTITWDIIQRNLTSIVGNVCLTHKRELLIVCESLTEEARNWLTVNRNMKEVQPNAPANPVFTVVDLATITNESSDKYETLALCCGCDIYDPVEQLKLDTLSVGNDEVVEKIYGRFLGSADTVIIEPKHTQVIFSKSVVKTHEEAEAAFEIIDKNNKEIDASEDENKIKKLRDENIELESKPYVRIHRKIKELEDKIALMSKSEKIQTPDEAREFYRLQAQLSDLKGSAAIFHVGGKTDTERDTKERLLEDALKASKSAIKYGYVVGGNLIVPSIINDKANREEILKILIKKYPYINEDGVFATIIGAIKNAFLESYRTVLSNSYLSEQEIDKIINDCLKKKQFYNLKTHKYETFDETAVINSAETDIQILKSTISIIGILSTSNQVITYNINTDNYIEDKKPQ